MTGKQIKSSKTLTWFFRIIFGVPAVLILVVIVGVTYTELNKAYWDYQVRRLCEKDGGRKIFSEIILPESEYNDLLSVNGYVDIPLKGKNSSGDKFIWSSESTILSRGSFGLIVIRSVYNVIRLKDKRLIAEQITYGRGGGDFPFSASHGTSFTCPEFKDNQWHKKIFSKND